MEDSYSPDIKHFLRTIEQEGIKDVQTTFELIYDVWDKLGLKKEQQVSRSKTAWSHVLTLLKDIVKEEDSIYENVKVRIQSYTVKIEELSKILCSNQKNFEGSLIEKELQMRQELDSLTKLKSQRIRMFQDYKNQMVNYCRVLNSKAIEFKWSSEIPSEKEIEEIRNFVDHLENEKEKRLAKVFAAKKQLSTILEATELPPETPLEQDILSGHENFSLSEEILAQIDEVVLNASKKQSLLESQKKDLMNKLSNLWAKLQVDEQVKVKFLSKHLDCRVSTLKSIEDEVDKYELLKKSNLQNIIENLRQELEELWCKCYVSEHQKNLHPAPVEFTDTVLTELEKQIEEWKEYHYTVKHILTKIEERQKLFDLLKVFEKKASNPGRFKNRKGNLLQEEKERKKLQKDLPALEGAIFKEIQEYESNNGRPFLYYGGDYRTFVENQWTEWRNEKETERLKKHKKNLLQLRSELTANTIPKKRAQTTPKSAPSKLFKAASGNAVGYTPTSKMKFFPNTVCRLRSKIFYSPDRELLRAKYVSSPTLDDTTYTLFAGELNNAEENQLESTVIIEKRHKNPKQQKRKTMKVIRRSPRNNMSKSTSKLSPMRGKFGLPFII